MKAPSAEGLKKTLIILSSAALALGILAYLVVFFPTGGYTPVVVQGDNGTTFASLPTSTLGGASSTFITLPTGTASSSSATSTVTATAPGTYATSYTAPYPVMWNEGGESFAVTGASYAEGELTLTISVQIGSASTDCVPDNMRLIVDESGTQESPSSPAGPNFSFPDTGTCMGTPGATYSESLIFPIAATIPSPFLVTTGGSSNVFFTAATSTTGGVDVALPGTQG
ncbi:MAG TPA: hypothetical protein VHZ04_00975 [Candidatus Paceibacterota bacterium]|jgi:hypothetical protein|nr:hypothetical protein [Candidatus Paceibacterota bacterium]